MKKLIDLFEELPTPLEKKVEFSAIPIEQNSNHRIGKTKYGEPCLLIKVKEETSNDFFANTKLKNIKVWFDIQCTIDINNKNETQIFTIITFSGEESSLYVSFLRVAELLLEELGNEPTKKEVSRAVNTLVKLFKNISDFPKKTIQGLWSELFFIANSNNLQEMIKAWHVNPEDKHDFNLGNSRIEAKSASHRKREHFFSLEQLNIIKESKIYIVSMFVERSDNGKSMEDLVEIIKQRLNGNYELLEKVYLICYKTLGNSLDLSFRFKFDEILAYDSIKFYDLEKIPRIAKKDLPKGIIDVKLKIDLENVEFMSKKFHNRFILKNAKKN